jgi:putative FmdB family regulatory protein
MPIFEYHCNDCDTKFEQRRSFMQANDPLNCPQCESPDVKRLLSMFMISLSSAGSPASAGSHMAGGGCACGGACSCRA